MSSSESVEVAFIPASTCCYCMSFRSGMKLLFAWSLFWMFCWYMTCQFIFNGGEYNEFNNGGFITRNVPIVVSCTLLTLVSVILEALYLFYQDTAKTRYGLVVASAIMLIIALVFTFGGVPIMIIDIVLMGYSVQKAW